MIEIKKIKPLFNHILLTAEVYKPENNSLIITEKEAKGAIKEIQKVIAVGNSVREVKEGDTVVINPTRYEVKKFKDGSMNDGVIQQNKVISYNFPMVELEGVNYLYLTENDISYIVEEYEEHIPTTIVKDKDVRGIIIQ